MKRLLLIAHVFPPAPSPGALRPGYLARYLSRFGWEVTVITNSGGPLPFPARVFSTAPPASDALSRPPQAPPSKLKLFLWRIKEMLFFPDTTVPWVPPALKIAEDLLRRERFDAILSTAHPPSVHVIGWILARRTGLPWIADYRDPWAGNLYLRRGFLRRWMEMLLERGMLAKAAAITTISQPIADKLKAFHRRRDVHVIPNAYDPEDWAQIPDAKPGRFDLCFTGSMYNGKRSPDLLFEAIAQLRAVKDPAAKAARVHFYGPNSENVNGSATRYGVGLVVRQHGTVSRPQAMRAQRAAAALLIFLNMDPSTADEMGSKFLEYVGARRPIIAFGPEKSVMREFIRRNRLGWFASNIEEAKQALRAAHERYEAGTYDISVDSRSLPTANELAQRFAALLDEAANAQTSHGRAAAG